MLCDGPGAGWSSAACNTGRSDYSGRAQRPATSPREGVIVTTPTNANPILPLSRAARWAVLAAAFAGLLFDGREFGLMPVASLSVSQTWL